MFGRKQTVDDDTLAQAKAMGVFSYALGISQVLKPGAVNRFMGVPDHAPNHEVQRLLGVREIATGSGIFFGKNLRGWMWGRAAGDVMDIAIMAGHIGAKLGTRKRLIPTLLFLIAVLVVDVRVALGLRDQ